MKRRTLLQSLAASTLLPALHANAASVVHVYKTASCDCCTGWVKHLSSTGLRVQVTTIDDTASVRRRVGIPDVFGSCHTAEVEGYGIEGHVPAAEIRRLLKLRPKAAGLAVPNMPVGSPGMEHGDRSESYDVLLIDRDGRPSVFARYPK